MSSGIGSGISFTCKFFTPSNTAALILTHLFLKKSTNKDPIK
ncbi:MAG: hypothetical protein ACTSO4_16910 [Promethearchaeota archaeon]